MKQLIERLILFIRLFLTRGKGTYIRMITNKYEDVFVENNQVGIICKKQIIDKVIHITIDFNVRLLVCAKEDYKIISKAEYIEQEKKNNDYMPDLTHLIDGELEDHDNVFKIRKKKVKKIDKPKDKWYSGLVRFLTKG